MFNKKRIKLLFVILTFCLISVCPFDIYGWDSNGVEVTNFTKGASYGMHIDHFTAFNPTSSSYVYNEAGGTTTTDGEVLITGNTGPKTLHISVPTLASTSLDFRLEGKSGTRITTWANIFTFNTTVTTDEIIPISEYITSYRLGVKVNTNGTDVIDCSTTIINHR